MEDYEFPRATRSAIAPRQARVNSPHRILVVDDDISIRQLNTAILIRSGFHVDAAEDGAAAWDTLQLNRYDLLITDNNMPKVTGVELLKKIQGARMSLPVIMATGNLPQEFIQNPRLKPVALLLKPYSIADFIGAVKEVLHVTSDLRNQNAPTPTSPADTG